MDVRAARVDRLGRAADGDFTMNLIQELEKEQFEKLSATKTIPEFGPGDTVIVNVKVVEGDRSRVQAYEGVCIGRTGGGLNESFTVRKISYALDTIAVGNLANREALSEPAAGAADADAFIGRTGGGLNESFTV